MRTARESVQTPAESMSTSTSAPTKVPFGNVYQGTVQIRSGSITTLTFYTSDDNGLTWAPGYDDNGTALSRSVKAVPSSLPIPTALVGAGWIGLVADQAAVFSLNLKS